jgi:PAS domain S-box-containing protein
MVVDLATTRGIAAGIGYLGAVLAAVWLPVLWGPALFAAIGTLLTIGGYFVPPTGDESAAIAAVNRALSVIALWAVAFAVQSREKSLAAYKRAVEDLRKAEQVAHFGAFELHAATGQFRWSEEIFRIVGRDSLAGPPTLSELLEETVHPDDRSPFGRLIRCALTEGEPFATDCRIVHPDGSLRHVHCVGVPERDSRGKVSRVLGTVLDVTGRRMTEEALADRERRVQSIMDTAPEGVITIDENGVIESFSGAAERLFGYTADEVIGRNVSLLMPSPHREAHDEYLSHYLRTGERRIIGIGRLVEGLRKDGTIFPMELAVGEVKLSGQTLFTGFVRDISDRRRMERELQHAQKMEAVGQLTGGIAHDFNNLLTVIIGNLEMLENRITDPRQRELLQDASEAAELGAQLTKRLLIFGRRQPLEPQRVNLGATVRGMGDILGRTLGETIEIRTRLPDRVADCIVDPGQVENVILNLAVNARDAMPKGGVLTFEVSEVELDADYADHHTEVRAGRYVMLAVTDTGTGMPPEVRERAFDPFFTTKKAGSGTGLGLSMAYGFVKQSGGHIRLYSEPGHGTTVAIYLPRAKASKADEAPGLEDSPADLGRGETVLLVEDDDRVRRVSAGRLRELNYSVIEAADGRRALELLAENLRIDIVFTDMVMPGGVTGSEVAAQVQARHPGTKVLLTSGYAEPDVVRRSAIQSSAWLRKPYSKQALARKLRELLDDRRPA